MTVEMISQITGPSFGSPETVDAAKAVVAQMNANGGLGGHVVKLVTCDDKEQPTAAGNCAHQAASNGAVAVVEGIDLQGTTMLPILQAAKIPVVLSPVVPADFSNPYAYDKDGGTVALYGGEGILAGKSSCKQVAVLYDSSNPVGSQGAAEIKAGVESGGATVVKTLGVPETGANMQATMSTVDGAGADCITSALVPAQSIAALQALGQSAKPDLTYITIGPAMPIQVAKPLGALASHMEIVNPSYLPGDPRADPFTSTMTAGGVTNTSSFAQNVYVGFLTLQQALLTHTGDLTAADVKSALDASTALNVPTMPGPLQYSKPYPNAAYARDTDLQMVGYSFNGTAFVPLTGDEATIDATPALNKFLGS